MCGSSKNDVSAEMGGVAVVVNDLADDASVKDSAMGLVDASPALAPSVDSLDSAVVSPADASSDSSAVSSVVSSAVGALSDCFGGWIKVIASGRTENTSPGFNNVFGFVICHELRLYKPEPP